MSRPSVAALQARYAYVDLGDCESTPRKSLAAEVYSLWSTFGRREFGWRDWAASGCYLGVDAHRAWRQLLAKLRAHGVPHEVVEEWDGNRLALGQDAWRWQALEGGLVCADCGELFRPTPAQVGLAWCRNRVWCEVCR